jgi:hypothetical protein
VSAGGDRRASGVAAFAGHLNRESRVVVSQGEHARAASITEALPSGAVDAWQAQAGAGPGATATATVDR